jgi:hypothetical protein
MQNEWRVQIAFNRERQNGRIGRAAPEDVTIMFSARPVAASRTCVAFRKKEGQSGARLFADPVVRGAAVEAEIDMQVLGMGGVAAGAEDGEEVAAGGGADGGEEGRLGGHQAVGARTGTRLPSRRAKPAMSSALPFACSLSLPAAALLRLRQT